MKNLIVKYSYSIIAFLMIVFQGGAASAATPWTVSPGDYRYDMSLYLEVTFATTQMDYSQYDVAAFVGDECRGIAEVLPLGNGSECLYLRARSNRENGEKMTFKYRDKASGEVLPVEGVAFDFVSNSRLGYPSSPHQVKILIYRDVTIAAGTGGSVDHGSGRVPEGTELTVSAQPAEGYHFLQWADGNTDNPRTIMVGKKDLALEAQFEANIYKLTYKVDDAEYKTFEVPYGTGLEAEAAPKKEGHTFSGWQGLPETMPAHDVTVNGSFSINSYKAVFKIGEEAIDTLTFVFGTAVTAPEAPEKEGHTFEGWKDVPATMPAHDIEVLGAYSVNSYKLTYKVDDAEYKTLEVPYGTRLEAEPAPEKEGHTFSGWQGLPETMPAHDVTVNGSFSINSYKAVFKIGEEAIDTLTFVFGTAVTAPEAPEKEGHTFEGWKDVPATMPAHDIEVLGAYSVNSYRLTYKVDDAEYKTLEVPYGTRLEAEPAPEKEGHTFSGWQGLPETMPAHDVTVNGSFSINSYRLVVYLDNEVYIDSMLEYGAPVIVPNPTLPGEREFSGWDMDIPETMPAHDLTIHGSTTPTGLGRYFNGTNLRYTIYTVRGQLILKDATHEEVKRKLSSGIYIINGKKVMIK